MRRPALVAVTALAVTVGGVLAGTLLGEDDRPAAPERRVAPVTLDDLDTATLTVARASFCDEVDSASVEAALGEEPETTTSYDNGEQVTVTEGVTDVAHEFACGWAAADGSSARAWVFAPPVDPERARRLAREAGRADGCRASTTPPFGSPSVGLLCLDPPGVVASHRGLFGDAWLTCELASVDPTADEQELRERADRWCAAVAVAASAG